MPVITALRRLKLEDFCEFMANLATYKTLGVFFPVYPLQEK